MITLLLSLALAGFRNPPPVDDPLSITQKLEAPRQTLKRLGLTAEEFEAWAKEVTKDALYTLTEETVFYHRTKDKVFELNKMPLPSLGDPTAETYQSLFEKRMEQHWGFAHYGRGVYYGTGIYAYTTPHGAHIYGDNVMTLKYPKGTRVFLDNEPRTTVMGCPLSMKRLLSSENHCRARAKALLRALQVQGVLYYFADVEIGCAEPMAFFVVDDLETKPRQIDGYFEEDLPHFLQSPDNLRDHPEVVSKILGCGPDLAPVVEPVLELDYQTPGGCGHPTSPILDQGMKSIKGLTNWVLGR